MSVLAHSGLAEAGGMSALRGEADLAQVMAVCLLLTDTVEKGVALVGAV
jgi:hypothetical protein